MQKFKDTKKYIELEKERDILHFSLSSGILSSKERADAEYRKNEIIEQMKSNSVHPLMEAGLFTTIVEDVSDKDLVTNSKIENMIEANHITNTIVKNTPSFVKNGLKTLYMTEDTSMFKFMLMATQYSDFVARAARYDFLVNEKGMSPAAALKIVGDEFINYNRIDSSIVRWLNSLGFMWFSKYTFGANKSMIRKLKDRPSSIAAMALFLDLPNPSEASFFEKDYNNMFSGLTDTLVDGTMDHIAPASTLEWLGVIKT
jgi:hypothetical protein